MGQGRGKGGDPPTFQGEAVEQVGHVPHQHPRGAAAPLVPQPHHQVRHHLPDGVCVQHRLRGLQQPLVEDLAQAVPALPFPVQGRGSALGAQPGRGQWLAAVSQSLSASPPTPGWNHPKGLSTRHGHALLLAGDTLLAGEGSDASCHLGPTSEEGTGATRHPAECC